MNISKNNIHKHEFLGRTVKVISQTDPTWEGAVGLVVDETKNTFKIEIGGKERTLPKKGTVIEMRINDEEIIIDVSGLTFRPEDRIKKAKRRSLLGPTLNFLLTISNGMNI